MTHGSLFSGIGGFDLAAEWMGWENVFHCEWNEFGKKVLHHYWPKAISYHDITKTDFTIHRGRIDILTGGFPCQPYSSAGKRKGKEDERHLWPEMLRAIKEIQPRWVVGENVLGLVNWSGGLVFHEVQADLEASGYEVWPYVLPAASVNAPHRRDRIWFIAYAASAGNRKQQRKNSKQPNRQFAYNGKDRPTPHPNRNPTGTPGESTSITGNRSNNNVQQSKRGSKTELNIRPSSIPQDVSDTDNQLCERGSNEDRPKTPKRHVSTPFQYNTWQNFPTQSPICTRNDGLSSRLDGITFSKWRNESIKAAGNAIVPQVVLQIFKAIQQYETTPHLETTL